MTSTAQRDVLQHQIWKICDDQFNEGPTSRSNSLSLRRECESEHGTDLNSILHKMSPLNPKYLSLKRLPLHREIQRHFARSQSPTQSHRIQ